MDDAGDRRVPQLRHIAAELPLYVDGRITGGGHGGIVNITLGVVVFDAEGVGAAIPAVSLRMTAAAARFLAADLVDFANRAEAAADPEEPPSNAKLN